MASSRVDPKSIRFTTASILVNFETSPLKDVRIDNVVDMLHSENWPSCNCPILPVISYDNVLWSLHNQWLWVYRKAKFAHVDAVVLDAAAEPHDSFFAKVKTLPDVASFLALIRRPQKMARMRSEMFFPTVKGEWKIHHTVDVFIKDIRAPATSKPQLLPPSSADAELQGAAVTHEQAPDQPAICQPAEVESSTTQPSSAHPAPTASTSDLRSCDLSEGLKPLPSDVCTSPAEFSPSIVVQEAQEIALSAHQVSETTTTFNVSSNSYNNLNTAQCAGYCPEAPLPAGAPIVDLEISHQDADDRRSCDHIKLPLQVRSDSGPSSFVDETHHHEPLHDPPPPELSFAPDVYDHSSEALDLEAISEAAAMHGLTFFTPSASSNLFSDILPMTLAAHEAKPVPAQHQFQMLSASASHRASAPLGAG